MSTDPLRDEHEALKRAVLAARKKAARLPETAFARAGRQVIDDYLEARASGVSREDALRGIETVLRDIWPSKATKFPPRCATCEDTGWKPMVCWDEQRCGRERCVKLGGAFEHGYVVPCECRRSVRDAVESEEAAIARAVRATKKSRPSGFLRFGR